MEIEALIETSLPIKEWLFIFDFKTWILFQNFVLGTKYLSCHLSLELTVILLFSLKHEILSNLS